MKVDDPPFRQCVPPLHGTVSETAASGAWDTLMHLLPFAAIARAAAASTEH